MVDLICAIKNQNEMSSGALQTGRLLQNRWSTNPQKKKTKKNKKKQEWCRLLSFVSLCLKDK